MEPVVQSVQPPDGLWQSGKCYYLVQQTLFEVDAKYVPLNPVGRGCYAMVCAASNLLNDERVAIKRISNVFRNPSTAVRTLRELMIHRQIKHENVITLKDVMVPSQPASFNEVYLVYELMDTDLDYIIREPQPLSDVCVRYFMFQILRGLSYLHSAKVLHRDLKPSNILINSDRNLIKICDFGLSRRAAKCESEFITKHIGTPLYRAPEILLGSDKYGPSVDVWSVGCIFAELLGRRPIFNGTSPLHQLKRIVEILGTPEQSDLEFIESTKARGFMESLPHTNGTPFTSVFPRANLPALDLLGKMLAFNPNKRITARLALRHPYFTGLYSPGIDRPAPFSVDIFWEKGKVREMIWEELVAFQYFNNL